MAECFTLVHYCYFVVVHMKEQESFFTGNYEHFVCFIQQQAGLREANCISWWTYGSHKGNMVKWQNAKVGFTPQCKTRQFSGKLFHFYLYGHTKWLVGLPKRISVEAFKKLNAVGLDCFQVTIHFLLVKWSWQFYEKATIFLLHGAIWWCFVCEQ